MNKSLDLLSLSPLAMALSSSLWGALTRNLHIARHYLRLSDPGERLTAAPSPAKRSAGRSTDDGTVSRSHFRSNIRNCDIFG